MLQRTHTCGQLRAEHVDQTVTLCGWVNTYRDQGKGLSFVDLRDRDGLTQVVFGHEDTDPAVVAEARGLRREDVVAIRGVVRADFYWGTGPEAGTLAGRMRQQGRMWLLWPRGAPLPNAS